MGDEEVRFGVLGPVQMHRGVQSMELGARQKALLAALLAHLNQPVPGSALVAAVWGEQPPRNARNALQTNVSRLRSALRSGVGESGATLVAAGTGYVLRADPGLLDSAVFADRLGAARDLHRRGELPAAADQVAAALALWRGEPFEGLTGALFETERQRAGQLRLDAVELRALLSLELGAPAEAAALVAPVLGAHPLQERLRGLLMLALYRAGRRADALTSFAEGRRVLADELGVDPGPELQELHLRILRDDPELAGPAAAAPDAVGSGGTDTDGADSDGTDIDVTRGGVTKNDGTDSDATDSGRTHGAAGHELHEGGRNDPAGGGDAAGGGGPEDARRERLARAAGELAATVLRQWTLEARTRSLHRPEPLRVRWSGTARPVAAAAPAVLGAGATSDPPGPRGDLTEVAGIFRALPVRQLVVLGEPGSGKTVLAVLLVLGLLGHPLPGEPTPVLLPLSSWDPHDEHLDTWLARRLAEEYPGLGNTAAYGRDAALRLVTEGRVLPVLDGLDEMPPALHAAAIDALDHAMAGGRPVVVTCRGTEYEKAVHQGGAILAKAAVVEIDPVEADDAVDFLTARQPMGDARWREVADHLRGHPGGALAGALSTPLMVDLARTAYAAPSSDPAELTDTARFPDAAAIENHLLDAFLPAVYAPRPAPPDPDRRRSPSPGYRPDQAQRWLAFLARHLDRVHTSDLAWWHLDLAVPRLARGLAFGLPAGLVFALAGLLADGALPAVVYGGAFGLAGAAANAWGRRPGPARVEVRFRRTARRFLGRFAIGLVVAVGLGVGWSIPPALFLCLVVVFGFGLGAHVWLDVPADVQRISSPPAVLRQERTAALAFTLSFALALGLAFTLAYTYSTDVGHGSPVDPRLAVAAGLASTLLGRFLFRRLGAVVYGLAGIALGGLSIHRAPDLAHGLAAGAAFAVAVGLSVGVSRAGGAFLAGRAYLALTGRTPLRLMLFLDDAHRRGVLRQTGALYQFRHARLQQRLADRPPPPATGR